MTESKPPEPVSWHRRASVWLGLGINPATISLGGGLATQVPMTDLIWLIPLASLLLTCLMTAQGLIGRRYRQPFASIAKATFGRGAGFANWGIVIGMIGWGGFQGGVSGVSAAELLHLPGWAGALVVIGGLFILSQLGVNRWSALVWVTTSAAIALVIFAITTIDLTPSIVVETQSSSPQLWLWTISTILAYPVLFSIRNPDFTWDMRTDADVVKANLCMLFPLIFSVGIGALLFQATGNWNIADLLIEAEAAALGHLFLILSVISPLLSGFYSGALALTSVSRLNQRISTFIICSLGFVLAATRFDQLMLPFLRILGASLVPVLFVILARYGLPSKPSTQTAFVAWLGGAGVAICLQMRGELLYLFAGVGVSLVIRLVGLLFESQRVPSQ